MRKRIDGHGYRSLDEFEADFNLLVANCLKYNAKDTFFYKVGLRMQDQGGTILRRARREAERIGFDFHSGLHLPEAPKQEVLPPFSWEDGEWTNRNRMEQNVFVLVPTRTHPWLAWR